MHSWPTYPRRGVIGAAISAAAVAALAAPAQAIEISAPAEGSVLEYRCNMPQVGDFVQRYTVRQLSGKIVRVEVSDHRGSHSYTKPFYLGGTTLIHKSTNDGVEADMSGDLDEFDALANANVGWRASGWVTERRDDNRPDLRWHYTVTVSGREQIFNEAVGESDVIVIEEDRWADLYSSKMYSQVSPKLGFPVFWQYSDSNRTELRCELSSLKSPNAPAVASRATGAGAAASVAAAAAAPSARSAPPTVKDKLAVLDDLFARGLITRSEHETKTAELNTARETQADRILASMEALNRSFRQKRIPATEFIRRRTQILARVNARDMAREDALKLAKSLVDERLISQVEYTRKRIELTESN